jgi:hypothetical protein
MGCDLCAIEIPSDYHPFPDDGPDPFYFRLTWPGMGRMVATLAEVDAVDLDTPYPPFPEFPARPRHWPAKAPWNRDSDHPEVATFKVITNELGRTPGIDNKPPVWRFGSNDAYVITPDECARLHAALRGLTRQDVERVLEQESVSARYDDAYESFVSECASLRDRNPKLAALAEEVLGATGAVVNGCATETQIRALSALNRFRERSLPGADRASIRALISLLPVLLDTADAGGWAVPEDAIREWLRVCQDFADYCRRCQDYGGFAMG